MAQASGWSVALETGLITFDSAPLAGNITAGFAFDVPCRFDTDIIQASTLIAGAAASLILTL
ncbi:MAG: DUF2460 domain-containing protein [Roseibium sp.]